MALPVISADDMVKYMPGFDLTGINDGTVIEGIITEMEEAVGEVIESVIGTTATVTALIPQYGLDRVYLFHQQLTVFTSARVLDDDTSPTVISLGDLNIDKAGGVISFKSGKLFPSSGTLEAVYTYGLDTVPQTVKDGLKRFVEAELLEKLEANGTIASGKQTMVIQGLKTEVNRPDYEKVRQRIRSTGMTKLQKYIRV